jgi:hypothetical protein
LRLVPLVALELVAFLLILGETYLFFEVIVPIGTLSHNLSDLTFYSIEKSVLIFGLGVLWLVVMAGLTNLYVKTRVGRPTPSA